MTLWGSPFGESSRATAKVVDRLRAGISEHFGHAGPAFVRWVMAHRHGLTEWKELHLDHALAIRDKLLLGEDERVDGGVAQRSARNLAILELAGLLAHEALDLPWEYDSPIWRIGNQLAHGARTANREEEAFKLTVSLAVSNMGKFIGGSEEKEPHGGWLGFWSRREDDLAPIAFFPHQLDTALSRAGFEYRSIVRRWSELKWIKAETGRLTEKAYYVQGRPRMVMLRRWAIQEHGGYTVDGGDDPGEEPGADHQDPQLDCPF